MIWTENLALSSLVEFQVIDSLTLDSYSHH
jgi:hypothetical protein